MDFDGAIQIFILSFSWQPNKEWKRTDKWFCLGLRMGALEFMIFFLMVFLCWIFWVYEFGFWVYEFDLLEVSLLIERWENLDLSCDFVYLSFVVWENLLLGLCLCSCSRSICVCVWLTRKGKKMQVNLGMCSYV